MSDIMEFIGKDFSAIIQDVAKPDKQTLNPVIKTMTMRYNSRLGAWLRKYFSDPANDYLIAGSTVRFRGDRWQQRNGI